MSDTGPKYRSPLKSRGSNHVGNLSNSSPTVVMQDERLSRLIISVAMAIARFWQNGLNGDDWSIWQSMHGIPSTAAGQGVT